MTFEFTKWNKMGDHNLVEMTTTVKEFEYEESMDEGCGFVENVIIVRPGDYIVEYNGKFVSVISESRYNSISEEEVRFVKVMPDYYSNGVWSGKDGIMLSLEELDVSDMLVGRLFNWIYEWEFAEDMKDSKEKEDRLEALESYGRKIAGNILDEHPTWNICYTFDGSEVESITTPMPMWERVGNL